MSKFSILFGSAGAHSLRRRDDRRLPLPDIERALLHWTALPTSSDATVSSECFKQVADLLTQLAKHDAKKISWCHIPRTYTVLSNIGYTSSMQTFCDHNMTDYMLPYTWETLPERFDDALARQRFLDVQHYVLTELRELEAGLPDVHLSISGSADRHFFNLQKLGHGGSGSVDSI